MICPNCHDANSCGDYEGPTCEVCMGDGQVPDVVDHEKEVFRWALQLISQPGKCERMTTGIGSCFGCYSVDAQYTADRVCDACLADGALNGRFDKQTARSPSR